MKNSVFTNVAETSDGNVWWEGIGHEPTGDVTSWTNEPWTPESGKMGRQLDRQLLFESNFTWAAGAQNREFG